MEKIGLWFGYDLMHPPRVQAWKLGSQCVGVRDSETFKRESLEEVNRLLWCYPQRN